jgi:hypothetical protein
VRLQSSEVKVSPHAVFFARPKSPFSFSPGFSRVSGTS